MADFTQNITNSVGVLGGSTSKWGLMVWGVDTWGDGGSLEISFTKVISESVSPTWDYYRADVSKAAFSIGSIAPGYSMGSSSLRDGTGRWQYVFTSDTTSQNERDYAGWTVGTDPDVTFTCQAAGNTSWSEA